MTCSGTYRLMAERRIYFIVPFLNLMLAGMVAANSTRFPVQERDPGFQAVGHAHAVLHLKQGRQERLEVKVRHPVQIGLLIHILRHEQPFIRVIGIIGGQGVPVDAVLHAGGTVDELEVALAGAHRTAPCSRSCGAWACSCEER